MIDCFEELGLEAGASRRDVRSAYARKLKQIDPEKDRDAFLRLRQAYEEALLYADDSYFETAVTEAPREAQIESTDEEPRETQDPGAQLAQSKEPAAAEPAAPGLDLPEVQPDSPVNSDILPAEPAPERMAPQPSSWQSELRAEIERIYEIFMDAPAQGPLEMKRFAHRVQRESLEQSEFAEEEWLEKLYETSERWERGERLAKRTFVWLLEACEENFHWELLAAAPTIRQIRINAMYQIRRKMRLHNSPEQQRDNSAGFPWRYVFLGVFVLFVVLRACPAGKSRIDSLRTPTMSVEQAIASAEYRYSTHGFTVYTAPIILLRIPAGLEKRPLDDTHRFLLSAYAGAALPLETEEAKAVTDQGVVVLISKKGRLGELRGRRLARLSMHDPATNTYFIELDP